MIKEIRIQNYKSVVDLTLELGKTNVFIGENGCGKTNILEAVAMLSGAINDRLTVQDLVNVGVRVAKPSLTKSAFLKNGKPENQSIEFDLDFENKEKEIYKPVVKSEGEFISFNMLNLNLKDVTITINSESGDEVYNEKIKNTSAIHKRYNLSKLPSGKYSITVKTQAKFFDFEVNLK